MTRQLICLLSACLLSACQAPMPVRDVSTLTAKFAAQMDSALTTYVAALNANNESDTARIANEVAEASRQRAADVDDAAVWRLHTGTRAANVNRIFSMVSSMSVTVSNPLTGDEQAASSKSPPAAKITFDDAPLKTVQTVAGSIAKPETRADELSVISAYAKTVQTDLKSAASKPIAKP